MSEQIARLQSELAALRKAAEPLVGMPELAAPILQTIADKERDLAALRGATTGPGIGSVGAGRDAYIATNQTVNNFFGGKPREDGKRLLAAYLRSLTEECQQLRLYRLMGRRQTGAEQQAAPQLRLQTVYTSLTTEGFVPTTRTHHVTVRHAEQLLKRARLARRSNEQVEPELVRGFSLNTGTQQLALEIATSDSGSLTRLAADQPDAVIDLSLIRPELALDAIHTHRRLVLLGEPGSGKSTVLRYLALLLAMRLRGESVTIPGWPEEDTPIPILLPLGQVARSLADHGGDADAALRQVLGDLLEGEQALRAGLRDYLTPALRDGGVLLLCDGLDELPAASPHGSGPRVLIAAALRTIARESAARIVVTSRVLSYRDAGDWKLSADAGWDERVIQPLSFGQVRRFVQSWYTAYAASRPDLTPEQAESRAVALIAELEENLRLEPLIRTPLLLTMLAILHTNSEEGQIPSDRAKLYEECVQLLLERWESVRTPELKRDGLLERLGNLPGLDLSQLRVELHALAFQAHDRPPGNDGRGMLDGDALEGRMLKFFRRLAPNADPADKVATFLRMLREDAGLLQERDDNQFAFPHLTFQEYLAACALVDRAGSTMDDDAYTRWQGADRERWRIVLLLLLGRLRQQSPRALERDGLPWLERLIASQLRGKPKAPAQLHQDVLLAALSYAEIGGQTAFANSVLDIKAKIERPLSSGIVDLLGGRSQALSTRDRIDAARVLGQLGDPRYPVALDDWRRELERRGAALTAEGDHYWRYVPGGSYAIGGWEEGIGGQRDKGTGEQPDAGVPTTLPSFWVARFPVTVAQFALFVEAGAYREECWWTPEGWKYHQNDAQPRLWGRTGYHEPNQPVTMITWYEATAYCAWLSTQLGGGLPEGFVVRLPTEAEWEVAAAYAGPGERRPYPWGTEDPNPERVISNELKLSAAAPVGCCPAGAAACGALDLAGNVWEWTNSPLGGGPTAAQAAWEDFTLDKWISLRGGSYYQNRSSIRFGAQDWVAPRGRDNYSSFRVVLALH